MNDIDLQHPDLYINREISLIGFHRRVFEQARSPGVPLLERLRFLCITSSNLDEFFEIRVSGLKQKDHFGTGANSADGLTPSEVLNRVNEICHELVAEQYEYLNQEMLPALEAEGIRFLRRGEWNEAQGQWIKSYFDRQLLPITTPIRLDPAHPFPRILNKSLNFIVTLEGEDAFGHESKMAVVQAPRALPRVILIPRELSDNGEGYDFVFLSSIIHAHVDDLFPGLNVLGSYQFRVTRNSDLFVDPEESTDLRRALEGELPSRRYGEAVRLEVADNCPEEVAHFLLKEFKLRKRDLYQVNGPVNLHRLFDVPDKVERPDLKYPGFSPALPEGMTGRDDIFAILRQRDVLLHHPYQSFAPVIDFLRQAARDPNVLAIKQTLYRTGESSVLVDALVEAAKAGKEVTAVVELRARFDEEANINLANRLHDAGAHVVYGVVGYKTHAKMVMIVRREGRELRRYVHVGTGNYHARTARIYTDYGLMTANPEITEDVHQLFMQLTSLVRGSTLNRLLQAPFTLHKGLLERIERETEHARAGRPARIIAKMNALLEPKIIQALYHASRTGVEIDLIIRGICALRPGVEGISDNIRVRSVVGRFLEHTRIFYFQNGDEEEELYCSSADWMQRNLFQRVEECFPVLDTRLRNQIREEGLEVYLRDNTLSWMMQPDGSYIRSEPAEGEEAFNAQQWLLERLGEQ